jgi:hypothetical protein
MGREEAEQVARYLRSLPFRKAHVVLPRHRSRPAELTLDGETIGMVHVDREDGETAFHVNICILSSDLEAVED